MTCFQLSLQADGEKAGKPGRGHYLKVSFWWLSVFCSPEYQWKRAPASSGNSICSTSSVAMLPAGLSGATAV